MGLPLEVVPRYTALDNRGGMSADLPPADIDESDLFLLYVQRAGSNLLDTYKTAKVGGTATANLGLLSFDMHYQIQKAGTQTELNG